MFKNMPKTSLEPARNCSMQKSTPKNTYLGKITTVPKSEEVAIMHWSCGSHGSRMPIAGMKPAFWLMGPCLDFLVHVPI